MDKLNFITAGMPLQTGNKGYKKALEILNELNLDGLELEFVRGVRIKEENKEIVKQSKLVKTIHAPFYINLNSKEEEKIEASIQRIIETAKIAHEIGAFSITYHAGFYLGMDKSIVFENIKKQTKHIIDALANEKIDNVWIRPETTGKATQWGDLDEIINLSKEFDCVLPCVDFSHLHARYNGIYNTYDEFSRIFEKMGNELGSDCLNHFHAHIAGIAYSEKGEKNHLNLYDSDFNYKDLLKAFKSFDVKGAIVCESPNIETDCKILKDYYLSL